MRKVVPSEMVNLLQGKLGKSVSTRYYYRPDLKDIGDEILNHLKPLEDRLLR